MKKNVILLLVVVIIVAVSCANKPMSGFKGQQVLLANNLKRSIDTIQVGNSKHIIAVYTFGTYESVCAVDMGVIEK